jgi:carbonic anhydrase
MQKLVNGVHSFQREVFGSQRELFARLARGQEPIALFITCSDARINPHLLTQADPGDLFILRNAGNIVPPYSGHTGGEAATIEFAVAGLKVRDIIVCGHSQCGAMKGLLHREQISDLPAVEAWLSHAEATRRIMLEKYASLSGPELLTATVEENVLVQIENLRTHPSVAAALSAGRLNLHAWVYKIETGAVFDFNPDEGQYLPLADRVGSPAVTGTRGRLQNRGI